MESPAGTGLGGHRCRNRLTPGRKTPSRWCLVKSPLSVYTSTPLNTSRPSGLLQLFEWEASAVLGDNKTTPSPLAPRSPNVGASAGGRGGPVADLTPTAAGPVSGRLFRRRRINRRLLESTVDAEAPTPSSPGSQAGPSLPGPALLRGCGGPPSARNIQRQRAMVKKFMVTKKRLSTRKILNRGGIRL